MIDIFSYVFKKLCFLNLLLTSVFLHKSLIKAMCENWYKNTQQVIDKNIKLL